MSASQQLRHAVECVGREGRHDAESLENIARRFDLSPAEEQLLLDQFRLPSAPQAGPAKSAARQLTAYSFLKVFVDGTIDADELGLLKRLALRDHRIDDAEREVLAGIFARLPKHGVDPAVSEEIDTFKRAYEIP